MLSDEQKLQRFAEDTLREAEEISRGILLEVDEVKSHRLTEIENNIQQQTYDYIQTEIARLRRDNSLEVSQLELELRQTLLKRREEVSAIIYADVRQHLLDFARSAEYADYMRQLCRRALGIIGYHCDLYISPSDTSLEDELRAYIKTLRDEGEQDIHFIADKNIKIGGIRFYERVRALQINETLDEKLEKSREGFGKLLGPTLKQ